MGLFAQPEGVGRGAGSLVGLRQPRQEARALRSVEGVGPFLQRAQPLHRLLGGQAEDAAGPRQPQVHLNRIGEGTSVRLAQRLFRPVEDLQRFRRVLCRVLARLAVGQPGQDQPVADLLRFVVDALFQLLVGLGEAVPGDQEVDAGQADVGRLLLVLGRLLEEVFGGGPVALVRGQLEGAENEEARRLEARFEQVGRLLDQVVVIDQRLIGLADGEQGGGPTQKGRCPARRVRHGPAEDGQLEVGIAEVAVALAEEQVGLARQLLGSGQLRPSLFQQRRGRAVLALVEVEAGLEVVRGRAGAALGQGGQNVLGLCGLAGVEVEVRHGPQPLGPARQQSFGVLQVFEARLASIRTRADRAWPGPGESGPRRGCA